MNYYDVIFAQQKAKKDSKYFGEISDAINVLAGTETTYTPAEMASAILDAIPTETASGNPIHITDAANFPAESVVTTLEPVQDLHGYSKPWPAGGGKNLLDLNITNLKNINTTGTWNNNVYTINSVTFTINSDNTITVNGTPSENTYIEILKEDLSRYSGMILNGCPENGSSSTFSMFMQLNQSPWERYATDNGNGATITTPLSEANSVVRCLIYAGYTANNLVFKPMIRLATVADPTYEPYSNECPISGHTGVELKHSGADTSIYETHSITFPQAQSPVYGCEVDWVNGVLRVTDVNVDLSKIGWIKHATLAGHFWSDVISDFYIDETVGTISYADYICSIYQKTNDTTLSSGQISLYHNQYLGANRCFICDLTQEDATVAEFKSYLASLNAQLVYKLATPLEIPLTPEIITLLKGENNMWTDAGESEIGYKVDLNSYIQKPIEEASASSSALSVSPLSLGKSAVLTSTDSEDADEIKEVDEPVLHDEIKVSDDEEAAENTKADEPAEENEEVEDLTAKKEIAEELAETEKVEEVKETEERENEVEE